MSNYRYGFKLDRLTLIQKVTFNKILRDEGSPSFTIGLNAKSFGTLDQRES